MYNCKNVYLASLYEVAYTTTRYIYIFIIYLYTNNTLTAYHCMLMSSKPGDSSTPQ